jgi:hypothetical protein
MYNLGYWKQHILKTYAGVKVYLHAFLSSALDGGELSVWRIDRFTPGERTPGVNWIGGLVDPDTVWMLSKRNEYLAEPEISVLP